MKSIIRNFLKVGGAALAARGFSIDDGQIEALIGAFMTIAGILWTIWSKRGSDPISDGVRSALLVGLLSLGLMGAAASIGCKNPQLETGGAYAPGQIVVENGTTNVVATFAPDRAFYIVDASFELAYSAVDAVFVFERQNRQALWNLSPEIKRTLDKIRPEAAEVVRKYTQARAAYVANPTPAGLSSLETILGQLQSLSSAATAVLPQK
jgi:hypothetical protein